uniref:Perlwapin-like n=1 Tax=Sinocyclocheilus grahami TaxID=75366 RepID=A0A672QNA8_SINGR
MTAGVCCSLIAALFCVSVCLSTRAEGAVNGSIHLAARLLPPKPGVRLKNNLEVAVSGVCAEMCSCDCPNNQKCCSNGCGRQCMAPYKEKPGVCPSKNLGLGACVEMCSQDGDCPNDEKCCSNGCGHQCTAVSKEKPGVCPRRFLGVGLCKKLCVNDIDCPNDEKCCSTKCGRECTPPFEVRPDQCLRPNVC